MLRLRSPTTRLLHLQCSHGQSALGLWRATGRDVVGVDGSAAMLDIAREKARRLEGASGRVRFVQADVLAHPLNRVWDPRAEAVRFRAGRGYFDAQAEPNDDFPARAVERFAPEGPAAPRAWEHQWTLGQIVTAIAAAGLPAAAPPDRGDR